LAVYGYSIIPEFTQVDISSGWSILGYLRKSPAALTVVMSPIVSEIIIMKDENGYVYWPSLQINTIGNMIPGEGYQIKMSTSLGFFYPENGQLSLVNKNESDYPAKHYPSFNSTGSNMTVGIPLDSWTIIPGQGDEIAAFDEEGKIVGSTVFNGSATSLTIWGDDDITDSKEGIGINTRFILKLWNYSTGKEEIIDVKSWLTGNDLFSDDGISIIDKLDIYNWENAVLILYQNVPNPFDEVTYVRFILPFDSRTEIKIFDVAGRLIETPVSGLFSAGEHIIKLDMEKYAPGVYSYRLDCKKFSFVRSMVIY